MSVKSSDETTRTVTLPLRGSEAAACGPCAGRLVEGLRALGGVTDARVDAAAATLTIRYDPTQMSPADIQNEAEKIRAALTQEFGHRTYRLVGMDCEGCARTIERGVSALPGVLSASVNFPAAKMRVEYAAGTAGVEQVAERTRSLGFSADVLEPGARCGGVTASAATARPSLLLPVRVVISGFLLLLGLVLEHGLHAPDIWVDLTLGASVVIGGSRFALAGIQALRTRTIGTNLLMAAAALGAILLNHWEEAAAVVFLYALGEALEGAAMERTRRSLTALMDAAPTTALVRRAGRRDETIPATDIVVGDILVLPPGAKIAADGTVLAGASSVSEAVITGESLPREKAAGDPVYAGSINGAGVLHVSVTSPASDSMLARILHLVEEAQAQKAPAQALVERFGRIYTPLVLVAAGLLAIVAPLLAPGPDWRYRALTLLVVACPCALVIATPVAFVSGIARAARGGVLVKGGAFLEALAGVRGVALDKTGTLTVGEPCVTDIHTASGTEDELLATAAAAERYSEHPIARAIITEAERRRLAVPEAHQAAAVPGRGVAATVESAEVLVGQAALLRERGIAVPDRLHAQAERLTSDGKSVLFVASGGKPLGVLAVADAPRCEAAAAVAALGQLGLRITMLTGDNATAARSIGRTVGIADVRGALLPEDKLAAVRQMAADRGGVAFVGDGINDAPALAAATVGVAMGARGTAAALEAADLALVTDDLLRLPWAIRLARATRAVVRQNVVVSLGVVLLLLLTTVTGYLSLSLGVLGHEGSALLVILNGMRLLSPKITRI